jgi:hypothetical protein
VIRAFFVSPPEIYKFSPVMSIPRPAVRHTDGGTHVTQTERPNAPAIQTVPISKPKLWTGRVASGLVVLFLLMDSVMKFFKPKPVLEACTHLGLPESLIIPIGVILLACTVLYAIPQTSILGAILLTGYLGGAVLAQLRVGEPLFNTLFPTYVGILLWGGLFLREPRLRALIPLRNH